MVCRNVISIDNKLQYTKLNVKVLYYILLFGHTSPPWIMSSAETELRLTVKLID